MRKIKIYKLELQSKGKTSTICVPALNNKAAIIEATEHLKRANERDIHAKIISLVNLVNGVTVLSEI